MFIKLLNLTHEDIPPGLRSWEYFHGSTYITINVDLVSELYEHGYNPVDDGSKVCLVIMNNGNKYKLLFTANDVILLKGFNKIWLK